MITKERNSELESIWIFLMFLKIEENRQNKKT